MSSFLRSLTGRAALALPLSRLVTGLMAGLTVGTAAAQLSAPELEELEGIDIVQKLDAELPLDATFVDDTGTEVRLGDLFDGTLPAALTFNYTNCPQLCSVHLNQVVQTLGQFAGKLQPGDGYRIVTICIDPDDTPERAAEMKASYVAELSRQMALATAGVQDGGGVDPEVREAARAQAASGWHFLTGDEATLRRVADAAGFGYKRVTNKDGETEYAHQAATILVTPDGRVARYLAALDMIPGIVRMSLVEASEGKIGTLFDGIFLNCFIYDPEEGGYVIAAKRVMTIGGALMVLVIVTGFYFLKRSEPDVTRTAVAAGEAVR